MSGRRRFAVLMLSVLAGGHDVAGGPARRARGAGACASLAAFNAKRGRALAIDKALAAQLAQCVSADDGAWGWRLDAFERVPPPPDGVGGCDEIYHASAALVWCDRAASVPCADTRTIRTYEFMAGCHDERHALLPALVHDSDGEALVETSTSGEGEHGHISRTLLSHRASDGVFRASPAGAADEAGAPLEDEQLELADLDHDGRLDIVVTSAPVLTSDVNVEIPVRSAYHALGNARFSGDDAVARGVWSAWCPAAPVHVFAGAQTFGDVAARIVCARSWGVPEARVHAELHAACASFLDSNRMGDPERWPDADTTSDGSAAECPSDLDVIAHEPPPVRMVPPP